jgi:hypothetical protein
MVTIYINSAADLLSAGTYTDTVLFEGSWEDNEPHLLPVTLEVAPPLAFTLYTFGEPGTFQMVVQGIPGTEVVMETSADLLGWTAIATNQVAADGTVTFSDPSNADQPKRWYRARMVP